MSRVSKLAVGRKVSGCMEHAWLERGIGETVGSSLAGVGGNDGQ